MPALFSRFAALILGLPRTVSSQAESYRPDDFARLAGGRDCPVVVCGNPFADRGWNDGAFAAAVVAAMQGQNPGPPTLFMPQMADEAIPAHRVVLSFNGGATMTAADLCAVPQVRRSEPLGPNGRLRLLAAWCGNGMVLSECSGHIAGVRSPTDRRFLRLIAQVTRELFPVLAAPGGLKGH